ncbi:MAG: multicomponent Na+:H+ antiporter subunit C [Candidatus Azotimanducaceae bacterium]|jgi:multicomponent Na+:H+ antiporter subunit C
MSGQFAYWLIIALMMVGLYIVIAHANLIKKVIGLSIMQVSVFMLYIGIGYIEGAAIPIIGATTTLYSNPIPHVLILTAIVVGIATVALALAMIIRINESFGTIEEDELAEGSGEQ